MLERHTRDEWLAKLMAPGAKLTIDEFTALETYYAAAAGIAAAENIARTAPDIRRLSAGYADMFSVWAVAAVRALIRHAPWGRWIPPYPDSLVGRMDLREGQALVALELQRRAEIVDGAAPTAEMLASIQGAKG